MKVELLHCDNTRMIDSALSQCYDQPKYGDSLRGNQRIMKVCNVYKHDSLLEMSRATWEITASTKVLLEMTRHRLSSFAVKSTRYCIKKDLIDEEAFCTFG